MRGGPLRIPHVPKRLAQLAHRLGLDEPLIQHYNGTTWTRVAAPPRPANTTHYGLSGIAAVSPTDIAAVGLQFRADLTQDSMVLEYNGTAWSFATVADSGAPFDSLWGVAATAGGGPLWAVGHSTRSGTLNPHTTLILRR